MTKKITSVQVTDSIAEITRYQDREILERSLVSALGDILQQDPELCLYKLIAPLSEASGDDDEIELDLLLLIHYRDGIILNHREIHYQADQQVREGIRQAIETAAVTMLDDDREGHVMLIYPVTDQSGDVVSILTQRSRQPRFEDQQLVHGFLKVYSNYLRLLEDSQTDKLTRLLNRETLDHEILRSISRRGVNPGNSEGQYPHRREDDELKHWLVLIDLDFFKKVNDTYGHLIGDETLILFGRLMMDVFRREDKLFRYGGEEFVVLLRTRTIENLRMVMQRFRKILKAFEFPQIGAMTATLGVVQLLEQTTVSSALGQADMALYYGKTHGRDQIVIYEDLVRQGLITPEQTADAGEISFF